MSDKGKEVEEDADSLDSLSLSKIPLSSSTLKNAKLIKNSRMETTVELYNDPVAGSLQIMPQDIAGQISASEEDQKIINQLASLNSYDVYSLRTSLKKLGIEMEDDSALELSDEMKESLSGMTTQFTRPLIEKIFGVDAEDMKNDPNALQKVFRDPDVSKVRANLKKMTDATGIPMADIPAFLEEYSDVFLSVAYYKFSFDALGKETDRFLEWIKDLQTHKDVSSTPATAKSCKAVEEALRFIITSIRERLIGFQTSFEKFWSNISRESFEQLRAQIDENHTSMGAILCGLHVKIDTWAKDFPDNEIGGPKKRAKYVVTEMEPGIDRIKAMEASARTVLGMAPLKG